MSGGTGKRLRGRIVGISGMCALIVCAAIAPAASPHVFVVGTTPRPTLKVDVMIRQESDPVYAASNGGAPPVKAFFSAKELNVGPVLLVIRNDSDDSQQLSVDGAYSKIMGPNGGTAVMRVTFKRPGLYIVGVDSDNRIQGTTGLIKVIE